MAIKYTADCHLSPSELTSRIHIAIFLWTLKGFISPEYFMNFLSNLYTLTQWQRRFKFMVLRLLKHTFVSQKIKSVQFYSYPQTKLSSRLLQSPHTQKKATHISRTEFFERRIMELKKMTKVKFARVFVTCFDKFYYFCNFYIFGFCFIVP